MSLTVCEWCRRRAHHVSFSSPLPANDVPLSAAAQAALAPLTPPAACCLCLDLFPFLFSPLAAVQLDALFAGFKTDKFSLVVALSATHELREALLGQALSSASERAAERVRELLKGRGKKEAGGGVTVTLSDSGGERDVLALGQGMPQQVNHDNGQKKKRGRGRKRQEAEGGPSIAAVSAPSLSKAKLAQALQNASVDEMRKKIAASGGFLGPLSAAANTPLLSAKGAEFYVGGRYTKFARNIPQSKWLSGGERIGYSSVEELIGDRVTAVTGGAGVLGAAGREDRNVRMTGTGRPFFLLVIGATIDEESARAAVTGLKMTESCPVQVTDLHLMTAAEVTAVNEGAREKTKCYRLLVRIPHSAPPLEQEKKSLPPLTVEQRTPIRVLHRRGNMVRKRRIFSLTIRERKDASKGGGFGEINSGANFGEIGRVVEVEMESGAGLYIKEWVHGDCGRTCPSLSHLLGCQATFLALDVYDVRVGGATAHDEEEEEEDE